LQVSRTRHDQVIRGETRWELVNGHRISAIVGEGVLHMLPILLWGARHLYISGGLGVAQANYHDCQAQLPTPFRITKSTLLGAIGREPGV
jgi:hypothetical protein